MNQDERLNFLVDSILHEPEQSSNDFIEIKDKSDRFWALRNIRMPKAISPDVLKVQDEYLQEELKTKGVVGLKDIPTIKEQYSSSHKFSDKISLWKGDITRLEIGAIVNAANSQMLGCFAPLHKCIDNVIHSAAGMQLREECNAYMAEKRKENPHYLEPTGRAVLTDAYNLPSDYIVHTVGPIVTGPLREDLKEDLANSYRTSMELIGKNDIRSIAFCCISTGVFRFPNQEAAEIATDTVTDFLEKNPGKIDRVVFNVFSDKDKEIYEKLLS